MVYCGTAIGRFAYPCCENLSHLSLQNTLSVCKLKHFSSRLLIIVNLVLFSCLEIDKFLPYAVELNFLSEVSGPD